ncbi:MAG: hypothetical protein AAFZ07_30120, partial [Actinomycetota bacterium]
AGETIDRLEREATDLSAKSEGQEARAAEAAEAARIAGSNLAAREAEHGQLTEDTARLAARHQSAERLEAEARQNATDVAVLTRTGCGAMFGTGTITQCSETNRSRSVGSAVRAASARYRTVGGGSRSSDSSTSSRTGADGSSSTGARLTPCHGIWASSRTEENRPRSSSSSSKK